MTSEKTTQRLKKLGAVVLMAALAATMVGADADARRRKGRDKKSRNNNASVSNVTIDFFDSEPEGGLRLLLPDPTDEFRGTISKVKGCDGRQDVEVFRGAGGTVGKVMASSNGDWTVQVEDPGDDSYYAKVVGVRKRGNRTCSRGTSALITVDDNEGSLF